MKIKSYLIMLMMLVSISFVYASQAGDTLTLDNPDDSETISGTYNISVSIDNADNITYAWFSIVSTDTTGNSTTVEIARVDASQVLNNSKHIDFTDFDTTQYNDGITYTVSVVAQNGTGVTGENFTLDTSINVVIDNTVPGVPVISSSVSETTVILTATINSKNVTSCTGTFSGNNPGQAIHIMADTGSDTCTKTINDLASGDYTWTATGTDGTDISASSSSDTFSISSGSGSGGGIAALSGVSGVTLTQDESGNVQFTQTRVKKEFLGIPAMFLFAGLGIILGILVFVAPIPIPIFGKVAAPIILGLAGFIIGFFI